MYRISKSRAVAHEIVFKRHYEESDLAVGRPVASSDPETGTRSKTAMLAGRRPYPTQGEDAAAVDWRTSS
jgi:hypothetical protein